MKTTLRTILATAALLASGFSSAGVITTIDLSSTFYGTFNKTIDESVNSTSAYLIGQASGYYFTGNIVFTNNAGMIENVLSTNGNDYYYWSWNSKQNSLIGTKAMGSATTRVELLNNNVLTSYMADINALNGNQSFCCTAASAVLKIATAQSATVAAVPEPTSYSLWLAGLGMMAFTLRHRKPS